MPNPRTPTKLKLMRGTQRKDRANPREPRPKTLAATAQPPPWLEVSDLARKAWKDIAPMLRSLGVLTDADRVSFGLLCDALAEYIVAKRIVEEEGATYWTNGDSPMQRAHPAVGIKQDAWRRARLMIGEFGLTPSSRAKVSGGSSESADPLESWMEGAG